MHCCSTCDTAVTFGENTAGSLMATQQRLMISLLTCRLHAYQSGFNTVHHHWRRQRVTQAVHWLMLSRSFPELQPARTQAVTCANVLNAVERHCTLRRRPVIRSGML
jgi:hypothetical protein